MQDHDPIPAAMKLKALELLDLRDRALEERQRVNDDFASSLKSLNEKHMALSMAVGRTAANYSHRALLLRKLSALEKLMHEVWCFAGKFIADIPDRLTFPLLDSVNNNSVEITNDVDVGLSDNDSDSGTESDNYYDYYFISYTWYK